MLSLSSGIESCNGSERNIRIKSLGISEVETVGRLEVCFEGFWGSVCDDIPLYSAPTVACKELGYFDLLTGRRIGASFHLSASFQILLHTAEITSLGPYGADLPNIPIVLDEVACTGGETSLLDCPSNEATVHDCTNWENAVLKCTGKQRGFGFRHCLFLISIIVRECENRDIQLVKGYAASDGEVQICQNGLWTSVCGEKWGYRESRVVCKQFGYNGSSK